MRILTEKCETNMHKILRSVLRERVRQTTKWGIQSHSIPDWMMILGEEFGEACKAANECHFRNKPLADLRKEIVQTVAVGFAIIESIDNYEEMELEKNINRLFGKTR